MLGAGCQSVSLQSFFFYNYVTNLHFWENYRAHNLFFEIETEKIGKLHALQDFKAATAHDQRRPCVLYKFRAFDPSVCDITLQTYTSWQTYHWIIETIPDMLMLDETWLKKSILDNEIFPAEYKIFRFDRIVLRRILLIQAILTHFVSLVEKF